MIRLETSILSTEHALKSQLSKNFSSLVGQRKLRGALEQYITKSMQEHPSYSQFLVSKRVGVTIATCFLTASHQQLLNDTQRHSFKVTAYTMQRRIAEPRSSFLINNQAVV